MKSKSTRLMLSKTDLELRRLGQATLRELAVRYGVSQTKMWKVLSCLGLAGQRRRVCRRSQPAREVVFQEAARGLSLRRIAKQVGLSHEQVRQMLARPTTLAQPVRRCGRCRALTNTSASGGIYAQSLCLPCWLIKLDCSLSERLRALRLARNWTQQELAEACGVSRSTVFSVESKGHEPGLHILHKLASALQVSLFILIGGNVADDPGKTGAAAV